MTRLALCLLLLATGASANESAVDVQGAVGPRESVIDVQHDSRRGATCYILNDKAISCIPDSLLHLSDEQQSSTSKAKPEPTSLVGPAHWIEERYEL